MQKACYRTRHFFSLRCVMLLTYERSPPAVEQPQAAARQQQTQPNDQDKKE
jgi:hypothetical protein